MAATIGSCIPLPHHVTDLSEGIVVWPELDEHIIVCLGLLPSSWLQVRYSPVRVDDSSGLDSRRL